jgi:Family of unknown function (DUF6508)
MEPIRQPTLEEIEVLTAFLPRLYAQDFSPVTSWEGGKREGGTFTLPYPKYNRVVEEFFHIVASEGWIDYDYDPEQASEMLKDEDRVKTASLSQIKTMLTFCLRGERFSDGHWAQMIEEGYIRRLLERLNEIKSKQFLQNPQ